MLFYDNSDNKAKDRAVKAKELFFACVKKLQATFEPMDVVDMLRSPHNRVQAAELDEAML